MGLSGLCTCHPGLLNCICARVTPGDTEVSLLPGHSFTMAYMGGLLLPHLPLAHPPLYHLESFLYPNVITGHGVCLPLDMGSVGARMLSVCPPLDPKAWPA